MFSIKPALCLINCLCRFLLDNCLENVVSTSSYSPVAKSVNNLTPGALIWDIIVQNKVSTGLEVVKRVASCDQDLNDGSFHQVFGGVLLQHFVLTRTCCLISAFLQ